MSMNTVVAKYQHYFPAASLFAAVFLWFFIAWSGGIISGNGVWINDEGNRMLAIEAFAENNGYVRDPIPGVSGVGVNSYCPQSYFVRSPENGRIISAYPENFPRMMSYLYRLGGFPLVRCAVILSGLLCVFLIWRLAVTLQLSIGQQCLVIAVSALGTPLLFYSMTMFELSMTAAVITLSILPLLELFQGKNGVSVKRIRCAGYAGFLVGISLFLREEGYVIAAATVLALLICRIKWQYIATYAAAFLIPMGILWLMNYRQCEDIFGLHNLVYQSFSGETAFSLKEKWDSIYYFLVQPNMSGIIAVIIGSLCIAAPFTGFLPDKDQFSIVKNVVLVLLGVIAILNLVTLHPCDIGSTLRYQSLCGTALFVLLPCLFFRDFYTGGKRRLFFLWLLTVLAIGGITLCLKFQNRGIFFGPRHYLILIPLMTIPAMALFQDEFSKDSRLRKGIFLLILFCAAASQLTGLKLLLERKKVSTRTVEFCTALETPLIISDVFFVPEELAGLPRSTQVLFLNGQEIGIRFVTAYADKNKFREIYLLTSDNFTTFPADKPLGMQLMKYWKIDPRAQRLFTSKYTGMMTLRLYKLERR